MDNLTTFYCHGMPISDEQTVELFKNLDIVVMCRDGSKWLHGERYDEFAHLQKAVALVKELIADKEQPTYPEHLQTLTPEQKSVYMLGEWGRAEKGETMDRILYKEGNGDITCRSRDFDKVFPTLYAYEDLEMTPEDIEQTMLRFSSFLMEMTGGRMSKTNYTVQAMVAEANDYQQQELEEAEEKGYDLGVESVLRNHFDIPWAEAADLRKNIDHLRELLVAEKEGRLVVLPPCKIGDTIYVLITTFTSFEIRKGKITGFRSGTKKQYVTYRLNTPPYFESSVSVDKLGKTAFMSSGEAEAALAAILAEDNNVPNKEEE